MNYRDFTWWQPDIEGNPQDPYSLRTKYGEDHLGKTVLSNEYPEDLVVAEGGAATIVYVRLQFETLNPYTRIKINKALLSCCELDTLAMVKIAQGWQSLDK
jgi:hypothetical protein